MRGRWAIPLLTMLLLAPLVGGPSSAPSAPVPAGHASAPECDRSLLPGVVDLPAPTSAADADDAAPVPSPLPRGAAVGASASDGASDGAPDGASAVDRPARSAALDDLPAVEVPGVDLECPDLEGALHDLDPLGR